MIDRYIDIARDILAEMNLSKVCCETILKAVQFIFWKDIVCTLIWVVGVGIIIVKVVKYAR